MTTTQETMTAEQIRNLEPMTVEEAENHPCFSHSRKGTAVWRNTTFYYFRCSDSPSGVHAVNIQAE